MYRVILTNNQARTARATLGFSQGSVANAVGLNRTYLSLFENGKYLFPDRDLRKLRDYYSSMGASFDKSEIPDDSNIVAVHDVVGERHARAAADRDADRTKSLRVMDGFAIPINMDDIEVEHLLSEYSDNQKTIHQLCSYDIRKKHSSEPFLFWDAMIDQSEVEKRTKQVLTLMAKNYFLIETLHGHDPLIRKADHTESELCTTGDFIRAMFNI